MDTRAAHSLRPGAILQGKYIVEQVLGAGGMGRVYLGTQMPFNRPIVIKVMHDQLSEDPALAQRFLAEANAVARLSHPNTVTVYDFGQSDDGTLYIIMEYVEGVSLGRLIDETGALSIEDAVTFAVQIAQALGEAHYKAIIHRDLKPDNVMVASSSASHSFIKVLDFGIAKFLDQRTRVTEAGSIVGTPGYMSPEQARGHEIDHRSDLYSLACCLYEMLTGKLPFNSDSAVGLLMAHQNDPVPDLPEHFPPPLNDFVKGAMAKNPRQRPADAAAFAAQLMNCFMQTPVPQRRDLGGRAPMGERLHLLAACPAAPDHSQAILARSATLESGAKPPGQAVSRSQNLRLPAPPRMHSTYPSPIPFAAPTDRGRPLAKLRSRLEEHEVFSKKTLASSPREAAPPGFFEEGEPAPKPGALNEEPSPLETSSGRSSRKLTGPLVALISIGVIAVVALGAIFQAAFSDSDGGHGSAEASMVPAPMMGTLILTSDPEAATISIDGAAIGQTPLEHRLRAGTVSEIRFERTGREPVIYTGVEVEADEVRRVFASLPTLTLILTITSEVGGAEVLANGAGLGRTARGEAEAFRLPWPEEDLLVRLVHPVRGEAYRRLPLSGLQEQMTLAFGKDAFVGGNP